MIVYLLTVCLNVDTLVCLPAQELPSMRVCQAVAKSYRDMSKSFIRNGAEYDPARTTCIVVKKAPQ
jgi:hypothetical protein